MMRLSINHIAIGTRFSGSFHPADEADWWNLAWDLGLDAWAETAQVGDRFSPATPAFGSVYIERVE